MCTCARVTRPNRPIWAVRALAVSALIGGLTAHSAMSLASTDFSPARAGVVGTTEQVMAEHACGPEVNLMDAEGVVVSINGAATYQAGVAAVTDAYNERESIVLHGFCAR